MPACVKQYRVDREVGKLTIISSSHPYDWLGRKMI